MQITIFVAMAGCWGERNLAITTLLSVTTTMNADGLELLGKAIDEYAKAIGSAHRGRLRRAAYGILEPAHSYILGHLSAHGSSKIEDPKEMKRLKACLGNGTASTKLPKRFPCNPGIGLLGAAIDSYSKSICSLNATALHLAAYHIFKSAHSYIFMELDVYGSSECNDPEAMKQLKGCLRDGTAHLMLPKLFHCP